ncbi:hypothetical protein COCVIDRAFT_103542, partial [Bipolaris victoriae FI3]
VRIVVDALDSHLLCSTLSTHATIARSSSLQPAFVTTARWLHNLDCYHHWYYAFIMIAIPSAITHRDSPCKSCRATEKIGGSISKAFVHGVDDYNLKLLGAWKVTHILQDADSGNSAVTERLSSFAEFENNCFDSAYITCALRECSIGFMSDCNMGTWLADGDAEGLQEAMKDVST